MSVFKVGDIVKQRDTSFYFNTFEKGPSYSHYTHFIIIAIKNDDDLGGQRLLLRKVSLMDTNTLSAECFSYEVVKVDEGEEEHREALKLYREKKEELIKLRKKYGLF